MSRIRMLSESMIGKIAAGEVVERPASAIKELIENSLDAGATSVTAEIRDGGLSYIRVTDNGSGIDESDIRMAFERHATSKISREQDLESIATLGFRGEALASIAAVARVTLTTRTKDRDSGLKVINEGGTIVSIAETGAPLGTTIVVNDLFFNTPVRKGFMRKPSVEGAAIGDILTQFVLSRPDVSFRFISAGKTVLHSPGDGQMASAVHTVFGGLALRSMRKVDGHAGGLILSGYVGIGDNARGNRNHEFFFINGRMMHSLLLSAAVETACRERVMIGKFPVCALHLTIPYEAVDVNVHPNKLEVRFRDEAQVSEAVLTLVLEALKDRDAFEKPQVMSLIREPGDGHEHAEPAPVTSASLQEGIGKAQARITTVSRLPVPSAVPEPENRIEPAAAEHASPVFREAPDHHPEAFVSRPVPVPSPEKAVPADPGSGEETREANAAVMPVQPAAQAPLPESSPVREKAEQVSTILPEVTAPLKIYGALFNTYILVEYADHLLLIDQHAVHERLLFDRLMAAHTEQNMGQELLVPIVISVTSREMQLIEENRTELESIGLVMERFGERDMAIRTIPMILGEAETTDFVREALGDLENGRGVTFEKKRSALLQTACKHAVKGGEPLPEELLRNLVAQMIEQKVTPTCPHGRPLVVAISHRELDRKFKRIQ